MNYLSDLDADQRRAVLHTTHRSKGNRPLIVCAGPGAGKTHLLASCVGHAIWIGVEPSKILLLAFGRKATRELRQRLAGLREHAINCDDVSCTTFHSLALTIVREFYGDCGLGSNFTIASGDAVDTLLTQARQKLSSKDREQLRGLSVSELKRVFTYRINSCRKLAVVLKRTAPKYEPAAGSVRALYRKYQRLKGQNNVIDFDDLLRLCLILLRQHKAGDQLRRRYARIFVDEYQDTSRIQALILQQLRPSGKGVTVVGDSRQAIFSFRGANVRSLKQAKNLFLRPACTIRLTENYRSQARTVAACNALMEDKGAPMRAIRPKGKWPLIRHVPDGPHQARQVAAAIKRSRRAGVPLREQAVLVRTIVEADLLEEELERLGIPFAKNGGPQLSNSQAMSSFSRTVRWLLNPLDFISGLSVVRLVLGIGATKASMICEAAKNVGVEEVDQHVRIPATSRPAWNVLVSIGREIRKRNSPRRQVIQKIIAWLETAKALGFSKEEKGILFESAVQSDDWLNYLDRLALADDDDNEIHQADVVTISTIHSAKGRQWQVVRILDVVNGMIPPHRVTSRAEVNEERRLLFVAMSRAKNQLEMFAPMLLHPDGHGLGYRSDLSLSPFIRGAVAARCKRG